MQRSTGDQDRRYRPRSADLKARLSEIHRKRWGAPEGFCTVRGAHVPFEHRAPVRYWSDHLAHYHGEEAARVWIGQLQAAAWGDMPRIWRLYRERLEISETRARIKQIEWELTNGNR